MGGGVETRRRASLDARYVKFSTDFPQLFEMVAKEGPEFDVSHLAFMMGQLDAIDVGDRSFDDAQKLLFTRLNGEFVDPLTAAAEAAKAAALTTRR